MDSFSTSMLSLLAQYDDLCRYSSVLNRGFGKVLAAFEKSVENQKELFKKVTTLESENKKLQLEVNDLKAKTSCLDVKLKHTRSSLIAETEKYSKLQHEKSSLERQIALIKELLIDQHELDNITKEKLVQLSSAHNQNCDSRLTTIEEITVSSLSSSDSEENDKFYQKNHNQHLQKHHSAGDFTKIKKTVDKMNCSDIEDVFSSQGGDIVVPSNITFRCNSEPNNVTFSGEQVFRQKFRSDSGQETEHVLNTNTVRRNSMIQGRKTVLNGRYSSGGKLSRRHSFVPKTFIRSEKCIPCGKIIGFCKQAAKCSDCRIHCHTECKNKCPLPCIPIVPLPMRPSGTLADYTSSTAPMIPPLIVHCINEIESRGFEDIGLYRVSGSERTIKELKEKFLKGKSVPSMSDADVHAICGTVKEFLRSLKDSLIPKAVWHKFAIATNHEDKEARLDSLYNTVCYLPPANKETLAFLILHLQRVAESPNCKMPVSNIAKVFGPTIIGYSEEAPNNSTLLKDTKQQTLIMEALLSISTELWQKLLNLDTNLFSSTKTPKPLSAPVSSRLGPIYNSNRKPSTSPPVMKTALEPRTKTANKNGRRTFFSPLISSK